MATPRRSLWRRIVLLTAVVLVAGSWYLFVYDPPYSGTLVAPMGRTLVFGHRGFGDRAPDNSLVATERALAEGMDGVDVDGQFTRDSTIVIFHDLSIDRLTADTGHVRDKTAAQMLALDLGPKADSAMIGAPVHTFEDFVVAVKGRGLLSVELKVPGAGNTGIESRAVEILRKHDAFKDVVLSSFNPLVLWRLKRLDARVRTVLIFMDTNWNPQLLAEIKPGDQVPLPWALRQEWIRRAVRKIIRPDYLSVNHEVAVETIDHLIRQGWPVFLWTPNDEEHLSIALAKRPFGLISDEALLVKRLRDTHAP